MIVRQKIQAAAREIFPDLAAVLGPVISDTGDSGTAPWDF
jgi:hypothetical protein